jgi:hypothetical protein
LNAGLNVSGLDELRSTPKRIREFRRTLEVILRLVAGTPIDARLCDNPQQMCVPKENCFRIGLCIGACLTWVRVQGCLSYNTCSGQWEPSSSVQFGYCGLLSVFGGGGASGRNCF